MRILLPTDGSRHSLAAARALNGWFDWHGGHVEVLAIRPDEPRGAKGHFGQDVEIAARWRGTVAGWLRDSAAILDGTGLRVETVEMAGDPAVVALDEAKKGFDLVAFGMKGRGDAASLGPGSVARALLDMAPTSVLGVRDRVTEGALHRLPTAQRPLRTVLAVDGGGPSREAVDFVRKWIARDRVAATVMAVADVAEDGAFPRSEASHVVNGVRSMLEQAGIAATSETDAGAPFEWLARATQRADLLVLGSATFDPATPQRQSTGLEVAAQSRCSVLIVRTERPAVAVTAAEPTPASVPFEIAYKNMDASLAAERAVVEALDHLERFTHGIIRAHVTLSRRHARHVVGNLYDVHLSFEVAGPDVVVSRTAPAHHESEDLVTAIGEAFDHARRKFADLHDLELPRHAAR